MALIVRRLNALLIALSLVAAAPGLGAYRAAAQVRVRASAPIGPGLSAVPTAPARTAPSPSPFPSLGAPVQAEAFGLNPLPAAGRGASRPRPLSTSKAIAPASAVRAGSLPAARRSASALAPRSQGTTSPAPRPLAPLAGLQRATESNRRSSEAAPQTRLDRLYDLSKRTFGGAVPAVSIPGLPGPALQAAPDKPRTVRFVGKRRGTADAKPAWRKVGTGLAWGIALLPFNFVALWAFGGVDHSLGLHDFNLIGRLAGPDSPVYAGTWWFIHYLGPALGIAFLLRAALNSGRARKGLKPRPARWWFLGALGASIGAFVGLGDAATSTHLLMPAFPYLAALLGAKAGPIVFTIGSTFIFAAAEEVIFRMGVFRALFKRARLEGYGAKGALFLSTLFSAAVFMSSHFPFHSMSFFGMGVWFSLGVALALIYHKTRSLLTVSLAHAAYNLFVMPAAVLYIMYGPWTIIGPTLAGLALWARYAYKKKQAERWRRLARELRLDEMGRREAAVLGPNDDPTRSQSGSSTPSPRSDASL